MSIAPTRVDAALVRRLQARDRTAWEELYAEYHPRLRAFGYRLAGNAQDADDLAQETFVRALPALDRLDPERVDLTAYLFTTTKNLFLKQVERSKRAEPTAEVPEPDLPAAIEDDPERSALLARQQQEVRIANARLDPRQRLVLALCELEDRSYAEIGELVGLNENAVAQLVFRARERLRTELRLVQVDPERLPEECRAFLPLLAQHLDGKLHGAKLETTLAHLEGCERCQAALADMREAKRRYRALLLPPLGMPVEEARAGVENELERAGYWGGRGSRGLIRRPRGSAAVAGAVAAATLLALAGGGTAVLLVETDSPSTPLAAGEPSSTTVETAAPTPTPGTTQAIAAPPAAKPKPKPKPVVMPKTTTQAVTTAPTPAAAAPKAKPKPKPPQPTPKPKPKPAPKVVPPPAVTEDSLLRGQSPDTTAPPLVTTAPPPPPPDTTAPTVSFGSTPPATTTSRTASFSFSANETGASFACSYDSGPFQPCQSPHTVTEVGVDDHTLAVRATDAAGNLGPPATAAWTVVAPLPDLVAVLADTSVTVRNTGEAPAGPSLVTVTGIGTFSIPALAPGQAATRSLRCVRGTHTATADYAQTVVEANEQNNVVTHTASCLGLSG